MASQNGLHLLYAPPEGTKVTAYIVFVHGLFGHPLETWTGKESKAKSPRIRGSEGGAQPNNSQEAQVTEGDRSVLWPQKLLPLVTPDVNIYTFGHDANVDNFLSSAGQNTLHQTALTLLSDLADIRPTPVEQAIPIIFVVHSLGGIIVKDAINQSASIVGTRLKDIGPSVHGVCFLATPHRGSKTASVGRVAYNITKLVGKYPNTRLLQSLERNSEILDRVAATFAQTLLKYEIAICSFREEMPTRKLLFLNTMVVEADSAKIGDGKEDLGSIPADHSNVTKFAYASNIGFKRVSAQVRRWVENIRSQSSGSSRAQEDCLTSLNDLTARMRIADVQEAHEKTFHWLFDPAVVSFAGWLGGDAPECPPIYWIQGKPGSGKSTLMKFAMNDPRMTKCLKSKFEHDWIVAAYFFHDRGSGMQKTLEGLLQELLYSILRQNNALLSIVTPFYVDLVRLQRTQSPKWDIRNLEATLIAIVEQRKIKTRILLLIDALDEHSGDNDTLASLLENLAEKAKHESCELKMCLASRSWTVFQQHFTECPGFAIHEYTRDDVQAYVDYRLRPTHSIQTSPHPSDLLAIIDLVTEKALGVFIWVRLVVDLVWKGIRDGTPYHVLEQEVNKMPTELKDLYADTLKRIEPNYTTETFIMLHIVYSSLVPLPLDTFMASLDVNLRDDGPSSQTKTAIDPITSQKSRLTSRSGGLLEIISTGTPDTTRSRPSNFVQFIHQTVKDYVQTSPRHLGLVNIAPKLGRQSGDMLLLKSCATTPPEAWSCPIKRNVFTYAMRAYAHDGSDPDVVVKLLKHALPLLAYGEKDESATIDDYSTAPRPPLLGRSHKDYGLLWWLNEHHRDTRLDKMSRFYKALYDLAIRSFRSSRDELLAMLAVAMRFEGYVESAFNQIPAPLPAGIVHLAAAGPDLTSGSSCIDRSGMIKILIRQGADINQEVDCSIFEGQPFNFKGSRSNPTPIAYLLSNKGQKDDESRLRVAKTLFALGASPHFYSGLSKRQELSSRALRTLDLDGLLDLGKLSAIEYCMWFESAAFVRLWLQQIEEEDAGYFTPERASRLLNIALSRQDKAINRVLQEHGFALDGEGGPSGSRIACLEPGPAIFMSSCVLSAPVGGLHISSEEYA